MRNWIQNSPVSIGVGLIVIGLVTIFLAWNGAASKDFVEGQIPYVISGGIGGLVVAGAGITTIVVQTRRRDTDAITQRLDQLIEVVQETGAFPATAGPTVVPDGQIVIAGRSTYHDPECHIVEGRDDYRPISPEAANAKGLTPCRICQPDVASA